MCKKDKLSIELRIKAIKEYLDGEISLFPLST